VIFQIQIRYFDPSSPASITSTLRTTDHLLRTTVLRTDNSTWNSGSERRMIYNLWPNVDAKMAAQKIVIRDGISLTE